MAEKLRCGAAGIPAFFTGTGVGTWVESGHVPMVFDKDTRKAAKNSTPKEVYVIYKCRSNFQEFLIISPNKKNILFNPEKSIR